jgi:hypothetical protein
MHTPNLAAWTCLLLCQADLLRLTCRSTFHASIPGYADTTCADRWHCHSCLRAVQEPGLLICSSGAVLAVLDVLKSGYKLNADALLQVRKPRRRMHPTLLHCCVCAVKMQHHNLQLPVWSQWSGICGTGAWLCGQHVQRVPHACRPASACV